MLKHAQTRTVCPRRPVAGSFSARAAKGAWLLLVIGACKPAAVPVEAREEDDAAFVGAHPAASVADVAAVAEAPEIRWETSLEAAQRRAKKEHRAVLVWASAEWTTASAQMQREVWTAPSVPRAAQGVVAVKLDFTNVAGDADARMTALSIRQIPTIVLLSDSGREIARSEGLTRAAEVLALIATAEKD